MEDTRKPIKYLGDDSNLLILNELSKIGVKIYYHFLPYYISTRVPYYI